MSLEHTPEEVIEYLKGLQDIFGDQRSCLCLAIEALEKPLLAFIRQEVPFRLRTMMNLDEEQITPELVDEIVTRLYDKNDIMFDYEALDYFIQNILEENGIGEDE